MSELRTGQALFLALPSWAQNAVAATSYDPFHATLSKDQIASWFSNHCIFDDDGQLLAVFNGNSMVVAPNTDPR